MRFLFVLFSFMSITILNAQTAPNFIITDSDGIVHNLYEDHLDQGQTVVIKLFFTTCPPCIALAPWMENKYQQWGAGQYDVEFIELSTQAFDSNADVANYKIQYGVTFPGAGNDGGGNDAAAIYQSGALGPYYGTPTLAIISPDGSVQMGFSYDDFDALIAATGATGMDGGNGGMDDPTSYAINLNNTSSSTPSSVKYILKPENADNPKYDILAITGGSLSFDYPSADFPEVDNPVIVVEVEGSIIDQSTNALDLLKLRKHILELDIFPNEAQLLAADLNSDNNINALDLLNLQKALLELITAFPNGTPSWKSIPSQITLNEVPGGTVNIDFQLVKIGNVN